MCYIFVNSSNHKNILPVNISVKQIIKHGAIHSDAVFAVSTLSSLKASTIVAQQHALYYWYNYNSS